MTEYKDILAILALIWLHFFADFILQTDAVAKGKSKSNAVLAKHVVIYSLPFLLFGPLFAAINGVLHFAVDWWSSRLTSYLYAKGERHWFFVVIGLDQALHMTCLIVTYVWLFK